MRPSGSRACGSKGKLPESQVVETVKKLLKESGTIELDIDTPSDIEFDPAE